MSKFDVDKMKNTYAERAIFQLKKKVRQDKLLGNIGYLVFTSISAPNDYSKGIVRIVATVTNGIDNFDSLAVTLKIKEVHSNGILNIPDLVNEAVRIEKMIKKCIDKAHSNKDKDYREHLPYISTTHYPGTSQLQGKIVLFDKDSEKWNSKAMVYNLLQSRIRGLLYTNYDMIVGNITHNSFDWTGRNNRTFQADLNIDYECVECRVKLSIPFDYLNRNIGTFCSDLRLEEIVANIAEQLNKQVHSNVGVDEEPTEPKPNEKETNMASKKNERFSVDNVIYIEENPRGREPIGITIESRPQDNSRILAELWLRTFFNNLLLMNKTTARVIDDITYTLVIIDRDKDSGNIEGTVELNVTSPGISRIMYRAKAYTTYAEGGQKLYPQQEGMGKVVQLIATKIKEMENGQ